MPPSAASVTPPRTIAAPSILVLGGDELAAAFADAAVARASTPGEGIAALAARPRALAVVDARTTSPELDAFWRQRPRATPVLALVDARAPSVEPAFGEMDGIVDTLAWPASTSALRAKALMLMAIAERQPPELDAAPGDEPALDALPLAGFLADARGRLRAVNAAWCRLTASEAGAWDDAAWLDALLPEDRADADGRWRIATAAGDAFACECRVRSRAGGMRWCAVRAARRADGRWLGVAADIDAPMRARLDVARQEREMRLLADSLPMVVAYVDADLRYRFVNAAWERWFGRPRAAILDRRMDEILDDAAWRAASPWFERVLLGETVSFASTIARAGEEPRHVEVAYAPDFDERGGVRGFVARMLDISAHRRSAAALAEARDQADAARDELARKARALESSNRALEQFGYVVSHDLQEPLRMVAQYLGLIERRALERLDPPTREHLAYARDGALRMQRLIVDLLRYARAGRISPVDGVDLAAVMDEVGRDLAGRIADAGAELTVAALPTLRCDRTAIAQVLLNLVGNALKFRGADAPRVRVDARERDDAWEFAVADNGIGIDPQHHARVFEVFQRLHTRGEYPGTGIGLAICKKIVEEHGGRIALESASGRGATFRFTLPKRAG